MNQTPRILLLEGIHRNAWNTFIDHGFPPPTEVATSLEGSALDEALANHDIIGIRSRTQLSAELLARHPHLMAIGCFCIGTNQVHLPTCRDLAVPVFNAPHANTRSVAELVIGLAIMLQRRIFESAQDMRAGTWIKAAKERFELRGKTIGIIGYGHIGSQVSVLAEAMGMSSAYFDVMPKLALGNARALASLEEVLELSDVVTLHVPDTPETIHLLDATALARMKQGSVLINASRGRVVDLQALQSMLEQKYLRGAALDVFPEEPSENGPFFDHPLRHLNNVILTPHIGGSTQEAQANIALDVAHKLVQHVRGGTTVGAVNLPQAQLAMPLRTWRLCHFHLNRPGILDALNHLIASQGWNIAGQVLQTDHQLGVVLMDVEGTHLETLHAALQAIPGTLRVRMVPPGQRP